MSNLTPKQIKLIKAVMNGEKIETRQYMISSRTDWKVSTDDKQAILTIIHWPENARHFKAK